MKSISISILIAVVFIVGSIYISTKISAKNGVDDSSVAGESNIQNVSMVDGVQIIEINARGGYQPQRSIAKAGVPTIIRFVTSGTFDCSSAVRIPSMNISKMLPQTGMTDIDIGTQLVGTLDGSCGMGMYPFEVDFKS